MQLAVGRVLRPHGVRGEVSVEVHTDDPGERFTPGRVLGTDPPQAGPLTVAGARWNRGRLLVSFTGVSGREQAELLRGTWLTVDSADLPAPEDPDEFHDAQLIGLQVVTTSGEPVGVVTDVQHYGQDLLVIRPGPAARAGGAVQGEVARAGRGTRAAEAGRAGGAARAGGVTRGAARAAEAGRAGGAARAGRAGEEPGPDGELLVPFVAAIAVEVDVEAGLLVIDPPPGLLDLRVTPPGGS